jgi:hypothetical protein
LQIAQRLRAALSTSSKVFNRALNSFDPAPGAKNPYPERMISYYFVQALAKALAPASVLLEVPVTGKSGRGRDNHIDALVFNDREIVVAEFKRAWTPSHWGDLARDLARLRGPFAREIRRGFVNGRRRRVYFLLGADCWYRDVANAWKSGSSAKRWVLPPAFRRAHRDSLRVYNWPEGPDLDGYYFTWALLPYK